MSSDIAYAIHEHLDIHYALLKNEAIVKLASYLENPFVIPIQKQGDWNSSHTEHCYQSWD